MIRPAFLVALKPQYLTTRRLLLKVLSAAFRLWKKKTAHLGSVSKILLLCQGRLGDNIMSEPLFRALKNHNPSWEITAFVSRYMADFLREMHAIDRVVADPGKGVINFFRAVRQLRKRRYDLLFDLTTDHTLRAALLSFFCKSNFSTGYDIEGRGFLFNLPLKPAPQERPVSQRISSIAEAVGISVADTSPRIQPSEKALSNISSFLGRHEIRGSDTVIGVHPGGQYPTQRWPADRFALLGDTLSSEFKVVLVGSPAEAALLARTAERMSRRPTVFVSDSVPDLAALLSRCKLLICNNSGPLHLAAALGIATVSTMGPTNPLLWSPLGVKNTVVRKNLACMPCELGWCRIKTHACMKEISVDEMLSHARKALSGS